MSRSDNEENTDYSTQTRPILPGVWEAREQLMGCGEMTELYRMLLARSQHSKPQKHIAGITIHTYMQIQPLKEF